MLNDQNRKLIFNPYIIYGLIAFISIWYWHPDEHYQISELASYKLGITAKENLVWEFHQQMRSGILPFWLFLISKITILFHCFHPFFVESITRVISACLFVFSFTKLSNTYFKTGSIDYQSFNILSLYFWILPMIMVRFSSESISASLFWIGFVLYNYSKVKIEIKKLLFIGFVWGISFHIRMHLAILMGIAMLWVYIFQSKRRSDCIFLFIGFLGSIIVELGANYWLYHSIVWTPYFYFKLNVVNNVASKFGREPFYFYGFELIKNLFPILSAIYLLGVLKFFKNNKTHIFTWLIISFLVIHSLIPHKEFRFIFPILPLIVLVGARFVLNNYSNSRFNIVKIMCIFNLILFSSNFIIQSFKPYNLFRLYKYTSSNKTIYFHDFNPYKLIHDENNQMYSYFLKNKDCSFIKLTDFSQNSIKILTSEENLGKTFSKNGLKFELKFESIPQSYSDKIPASIYQSIEKLYIYERVDS